MESKDMEMAGKINETIQELNGLIDRAAGMNIKVEIREIDISHAKGSVPTIHYDARCYKFLR